MLPRSVRRRAAGVWPRSACSAGGATGPPLFRTQADAKWDEKQGPQKNVAACYMSQDPALAGRVAQLSWSNLSVVRWAARV